MIDGIDSVRSTALSIFPSNPTAPYVPVGGTATVALQARIRSIYMPKDVTRVILIKNDGVPIFQVLCSYIASDRLNLYQIINAGHRRNFTYIPEEFRVNPSTNMRDER
jgi:hypothetical protein